MADSDRGRDASKGRSEDLNLRLLIRVLWAGKWLIVSLGAAATIVAVIVSLMLPNIYRAEALLAPNQEEGAGALSALAAQYGGLASLAGIDLSSGSSDKTAFGIETLKSRKFISQFIERHNILVPLMAAKGWDAGTGNLQLDSDVYDSSTGQWLRTPKPPRTAAPSMQEAYREFAKLLGINDVAKPGFIAISIDHYSPLVAKQWVDWLVEDINSAIMAREVAEAEQAIAYLEEQIESTSVADLQLVMFRLIEEQTKTIMFARVSPEYLFTTVDPAVAPERKAKPNRALIVILSMILGGLLGVVIVLVRNGLK